VSRDVNSAVSPVVPRTWKLGVFLVALSLLMNEVALTRIFSLVMWYYFAVLSISLALFGHGGGRHLHLPLPDVDTLESVARATGLSILYTPFGGGHGLIQDLVQAPDYESFWRNYPIDITPPTDDKPFFFQMLRLTDLPRLGWDQLWGGTVGQRLRFVPVATLGVLLNIVSGLTAVFVIGPMWKRKRGDLRLDRTSALFISYFTCLGVGFMMLEVGLIQKFILFVGHPTYAFALILFSLLLGSSVGLGAQGAEAHPGCNAHQGQSRWLFEECRDCTARACYKQPALTPCLRPA
jgi:hypothetical protein